MGKRTVTVKKKIKGASVDYCYIDGQEVRYETAQLDYSLHDRQQLTNTITALTGRQGVKVLSVTDVVRVYVAPVDEFLQIATMVDIYNADVLTFEQ